MHNPITLPEKLHENRHEQIKMSLLLFIVVIFFMSMFSGQTQADSLVPPDDPRQSITYWKSHTISADSDSLVAQSHEVFSVLLRAWDSSRLDPGLYVVDSTAGPWAASLADGSILLSRNAIDVCMKYGKTRGQHLLAFVLAHELAHQRADDLWHQRFFRMVGGQSPSAQQHMLRGLNTDPDQLEQLQQKEAQADHDGLILMSSVGFDPHQVIGNNDFFTEWVENIWHNSCKTNNQNNDAQVSLKTACKQAQSRALRTKLQLDTVASQAMLYQMGVQAFVAANYQQARHYFTVYGRDYPSRAVISALAMTYIAEATEIHRALIKQGDLNQPDFYYPLILDATVKASSVMTASAIRGSVDQGVKQKKQMKQLLKQGIKQLEKAISLEPDHRKSYLMLASAYLLSNNTHMVRGVIQGRYLKRFERDSAVDLFLTMTRALEGDHTAADKEFQLLLSQMSLNENTVKQSHHTALPNNLLVYSAYYNSAANSIYLGNAEVASNNWKLLTRRAKTSGNALLFRMALDQIRPTKSYSANSLTSALVVDGFRLNDQLQVTYKNRSSEIWIEGDKFLVIRSTDGSHFIVSDSGKIINAWQDTKGSIKDLLSIGDRSDRPLKTLGLPDRQLHMLSGDYLAYDNYGLALHLNQNKVQGWFLY